jgi:AcrR family transcriptional regulator
MSNVRSTSLRQVRERDLVAATRRLFDERGMQDAPIEEIARSVGIARGLIYRHFSSKEELFVLSVTDYLAELSEIIRTAMTGSERPDKQLELVM